MTPSFGWLKVLYGHGSGHASSHIAGSVNWLGFRACRKVCEEARNGRIGSAFKLGCPRMADVKCGPAQPIPRPFPTSRQAFCWHPLRGWRARMRGYGTAILLSGAMLLMPQL